MSEQPGGQQQWMMTPGASAEPSGPGGPAGRAGWQGKRALIAGGAVAVVAVAVVLVLTLSGGSRDLTGSMTIVGSVQSAAVDGHCHGSGGYADIDAGTQVNVYDSDGSLVATGQLGDGSSVTGDSLECTFPFTVADVPTGETLQIEVSHRGKSTVTADEVEAGGVHLTLK